MQATGYATNLSGMISYAVVWQQGARSFAGRLELGPTAMRFEARASRDPGTSVVTEVPYDAIAGVRVDRYGDDRLFGLPTLVLDRRTGDPIRVAGVVQPGVVAELAEHLVARFQDDPGVALAR
jgi:hypothetical protein